MRPPTILLGIFTLVPVIFANTGIRCPMPYSLCNPDQADLNHKLDTVLNTYFDDQSTLARPGDRELVWWALAGGDAGRWWWDRKLRNSQELQQELKKLNKFTKRQFDVSKSDKEKEEQHLRQEQQKKEEEREAQRKLEQEERDRWNSTAWDEIDYGYCCQEKFSCLPLSIDKTLVLCTDPKNLIVVTPQNITLDVYTLKFVYANGTTGNLRDYQVPQPQPYKEYDVPVPTKAPDSSHAVGRNAPAWFLILGSYAIAVVAFHMLRLGYESIMSTYNALEAVAV
ncbi:hypothetical protein DFH27DRAFT_607505 [Peziza echinospora]|nr:hypothetical protein DFH27DRAFT_607505 [Peziza echinospora]